MVMRIIDDLSPLNDNDICEKYKSHIYPDDLDLNRENSGFERCLVAIFTMVGALGQTKDWVTVVKP